MNYGSVIFDMDGVILDYEGDGFDWVFNAVRDVLDDRELDSEQFSEQQLNAFMGEQGVRKCVEICKKHNLDPESVWSDIAVSTTESRKKMIREDKFRLFPEVKETLDLLRENEIHMGLVSNAPEQALMITVDNWDLKGYFRFYRGIANFHDLSDRKPHPDHLEFARAELKREPYIFVGDSESDILAANNADMPSIWVNRDDGHIDTSPDYEVATLKQLKSIVCEG